MRPAIVVLTVALAFGCVGQFGDPGGSEPTSLPPSSPLEGGASPEIDGSSVPSGEEAGEPDPSSGADASPDTTDAAPDSGPEANGPCETSTDGYGYARCSCMPGASVPAAAAVATCAGYDCCLRYAPDSGLSVGFGNPTLSSNLCACFSSADIAALLGAPATCKAFAAGEGTVVSSCP